MRDNAMARVGRDTDIGGLVELELTFSAVSALKPGALPRWTTPAIYGCSYTQPSITLNSVTKLRIFIQAQLQAMFRFTFRYSIRYRSFS